MTGLIIFACVCSSGVALCLAYIVLLLVNERKSRGYQPPKPKKEPIKYTYYETDDTLNVDIE